MSLAKKDEITEKDLKSLPIVGEQPSDEKEEKYLREMVEFEFQNIKEPGVFHPFVYGNTKKAVTFKFFHGAKYKVPRHVARWLESRATPIWSWRPNPDGTGKMEKTYIGQDRRFSMRPVYSR